jgi:hypothetical protein
MLRSLGRLLVVAAIALLVACGGDEPCATCPSTPTPTPVAIPPYNRAEWRHWIDADHDCQDTRAEVLIRDSADPVAFATASDCVVASGRWVDPYGGGTLTEASDIDIDHLVPLENAHYSGGWTWSSALKEAYANDLSDPRHLIAVDDALNQSKGSRGPDQWLPPNPAFRCEYGRAWQRIKARWGLTMTTAERSAVEGIVAACH